MKLSHSPQPGRRPRQWAAVCAVLLALVGPAGSSPAQPAGPATGARAAEAALTAVAAGQFPTAYAALEPLTAPSTGTPSADPVLAWSARLAQARILSQLDARLAAQAALPAAPIHRAAAPWAEAAWLLTRADLARANSQPREAIRTARHAQRLLLRLTAPGHPARAQAWYQLGVSYLLMERFDSALYAAEQARTALALSRTTAPAARWRAAPATERLALPVPSELLIFSLITSTLGQLPPLAPVPVHIGNPGFATVAAANEAFLDSALRAGQQSGTDSAQLALVWSMRGLSLADHALVTRRAADVARTEDAFRRANALARAPAQRAVIKINEGEFRARYYGPAAALPVYEQALRYLMAPAGAGATRPDSLDAPDQKSLLYFLERQAVAFRDLYAETADPRLLDAFVDRATRLADVLTLHREQIRLGYAPDAPDLDADAVSYNYALGVEAAATRYRQHHRAQDVATAFRIAQTAKAWRLLTRVGGERATAGLHADERQLRRFRGAIARLRRWNELAGLTGAYPLLARCRAFRGAPDSARAAREVRGRLADRLRQQFPALYARAFGAYALSLTAAQASLPANGQTAAIEFLWRTSADDTTDYQVVYAFVVQRTGTRLLRLPLPTGLRPLIDFAGRRAGATGQPGVSRPRGPRVTPSCWRRPRPCWPPACVT